MAMFLAWKKMFSSASVNRSSLQMNDTRDSEECKVCTARISSTHLGMDICRFWFSFSFFSCFFLGITIENVIWHFFFHFSEHVHHSSSEWKYSGVNIHAEEAIGAAVLRPVPNSLLFLDLTMRLAIGGVIACRGCRFEKCVSIGLEYEGPQRLRRKATVSILQLIKTESKWLHLNHFLNKPKIFESAFLWFWPRFQNINGA